MTALLLLKLFLVPVIIAAITLAGKRWGAEVAGALAGFPVVTGPILFFIAIEQSPQFAAAAAVAAMLAVMSNIAFGIAYSWTSKRLTWQGSLLCGWTAYFVCIALLNSLHFSAWQAAVFTIIGLLIAAQCYPRGRIESEMAPCTESRNESSNDPRIGSRKKMQAQSDVYYRMIAGAALVLCVTLFSVRIGAHLTGLFAVFPVMGSVFAVFSHRNVGQVYAVSVLRGMVLGFYAFTAFCLILAYGLPSQSILTCFCLALLVALVVQAFALRWQARTQSR